jgi:uncharacterized protein YjbI with pentapeptide repeats
MQQGAEMKIKERKVFSRTARMIASTLLLVLILMLASCGSEGDDILVGDGDVDGDEPSFGSLNSACNVSTWEDLYPNLSRCNLNGADLTGADLSGADLSYAGLGESTLTNVNFTGANLSYAFLKSATFDGVNLTNANLTGSVLDRASLNKVYLPGADFTNAYLSLVRSSGIRGGRDATFPEGYRIEAGFLLGPEVNLNGITLCDGFISEVNLTRANLSGATFESNVLNRATFTNANLSGTRLNNCKFYDAELRGVIMNGGILNKAILQGADLSGAFFHDVSMVATQTDENTTCPNGKPGPCWDVYGNKLY